MALRESALVPFYYMYSTGGIFGFYATGDSTEATDLLMVCSTFLPLFPVLFSLYIRRSVFITLVAGCEMHPSPRPPP